MSPSYKLTYFPAQGSAEVSRFLMSYGGIEFIDDRFDYESWPKLKPSMPFGLVPVLEHDSKKVNQSVAIARYFAKQVKLVGANDWEDLEIDAIVDTIGDLRAKITDLNYEEDPTRKISKKHSLLTEIIPYYLQRFDNIVKNNNGHFALGKLTWADFYFVSLLQYFKWSLGIDDIIAEYPNLVALKKFVLEIPSIKAWVEKRPESDR